MANPSKRRGTAWETAVVDYLKANGFPFAERRALAGTHDKGDVTGCPGIVIECKAERTITLAAYADEVATEVKNAQAQLGVAILKRRNRSTADAYVLMSMADFCRLVGDDDG